MKKTIIFTIFVAAIFLQADGWMTCDTPTCLSQAERNILWPYSLDPSRYYICVNAVTGWQPFLLQCQENTVFHFERQLCDLVDTWEDICALPIGPTGPPTVPDIPTAGPIIPTAATIYPSLQV